MILKHRVWERSVNQQNYMNSRNKGISSLILLINCSKITCYDSEICGKCRIVYDLDTECKKILHPPCISGMYVTKCTLNATF